MTMFAVQRANAGTTDGGPKPFTSSSYRVYSQSTGAMTGSPLAATNTIPTLPTKDQEFRVRMGLSSPSTSVAYIGTGRDTACVLTVSSDVYCWGDNSSGMYGDGTLVDSLVPKLVDFGNAFNGETITQLSVGYYHNCAVTDAGSVYCWGYGRKGRNGNNSTADALSPVRVNAFGDLANKAVKYVSAGTDHTCAISVDNLIYCWGDNFEDQLGQDRNSMTQSLTPILIATMGSATGKTLTKVEAGGYVSCALDSTGVAHCWGANYSGGTGTGLPFSYQPNPMSIVMNGALNGKYLIDIDAGSDSMCGIANDNQGYCWGWNNRGQLGDGTTNPGLAPVAVDTSGALAGKTLQKLSIHTTHTCALASDNQTYCWGDNFNGELGINDGGMGEEHSPVAMYTGGLLNGKTIKNVVTGYSHSCVVSTEDRVYCSGANDYGPLGDGTTNPSIQVVGGNRISYDVLAGSNTYQLQFAQRTAGTCEAQATGYSAVTGSSAIAYANISGVTNGSAISTDPSDPTVSATTTPQAIYTSAGNVATVANSTSGNTSLWDYSLKDNGAPAGTTYCLRMIYNGGSPLESYGHVAGITTYGVVGAASPTPPSTSTGSGTGTPTSLANTGMNLELILMIACGMIITSLAVFGIKKA